MIVDGQPNVRTCVTLAHDGMVIETQANQVRWGKPVIIENAASEGPIFP